jgi:hypothetical protein
MVTVISAPHAMSEKEALVYYRLRTLLVKER